MLSACCLHRFLSVAGHRMKLRLLLPTVLALALPMACVSPARVEPRVDLLGDPAPPSAATRTIVITPETKWVNVTGGDIVKFIVGEKIFAWNFNVGETISAFPLNQVAPPGVLSREVMAYVAPDPRYIGGDGDGDRQGGRP